MKNIIIKLIKLIKLQKKILIIDLIVAVLLILSDWISKWAVFTLLQDGENYVVIENFLTIVRVVNDGAAFSILSGQSRILGIVSIVISLSIAIYLIVDKKAPKATRVGGVLLFAGGFANGIERLIYEYVRDFISVSIYPPDFNFADSFVVCGAILIMISTLILMFKDDKGQKDINSKEDLPDSEKEIDDKSKNLDIEAEEKLTEKEVETED